MSGTSTVVMTSLFGVLMLLAGRAKDGAASESPERLAVEGPYSHENLTIYVVSGKGADSRRYITLNEGLQAATVKLRERGAAAGEDRARVNELEIENASNDWLFLQAGDVIEGGKQDRTIATDVAIAPHSAPRPVGAFCVEHGRWSTRKGAGLAFRGNTAIVGSNALKRSIQAEKSQPRVWEEVARREAEAAATLSVTGESPVAELSSTGTYNAIVENRKIGSDRAEYVTALLGRLEKRSDAVGVVVAINGEIMAADVYASPSLFRKLARKVLDSYALEAVLARRGAKTAATAPNREAALAFLSDVSRAAAGREETVAGSLHRTTRETDKAMLFEYAETDAKSGARTLLHRNFVKK